MVNDSPANGAMLRNGWRFRVARQLYNVLIHLLIPVAILHFLWRSRHEPAYRRHLAERVGAGSRRAPRPALWIHAVSLGEMRVARTLVSRLVQRRPCPRIQLTTLTPAGRAEGERMRNDGLPVAVRYLPLDSPWIMRRFIRILRPGALILIETELWPNLLHMCRREAVPCALVNARLSPRLRNTYRRFRTLYGPLLAGLEWVAAQGPEDARHLEELGARHVTVTGNLKYDPALPRSETSLTRALLPPGLLWLAGSTHPGEETQLLKVLGDLRKNLAPARIHLLLAPRHPARTPDVVREVRAHGFTAVERSRIRATRRTEDVIVLDTLGELASLYALADAAFIGGSLVAHGGQNPLEAIACGCPVIIGPDVGNFADIVEELVAAGAMIRVADGDELRAAMERLLTDPEKAHAMSRLALTTVKAHGDAADRTLDLVEPLLARIAPMAETSMYTPDQFPME